MSLPLPSSHAPARRIAVVARGVDFAAAVAAAVGSAFDLARARSLVVVLALALAAGGCARPDELSLSPEDLDRDRAAREVVLAEIERDHETLAALIASDRFGAPDAIYSDPELRAVALHLVEQARKLRRLASSDVLMPGAP